MTGLKNKGSSTSLYISGMPGTGKTATTLEVINRIGSDKKFRNKFKFIPINGMQLANPNQVYSAIYQSITERNCTPAVAAQFLDGFFNAKNKKRHL